MKIKPCKKTHTNGTKQSIYAAVLDLTADGRWRPEHNRRKPGGENTMTPEQFKQARVDLGHTQQSLADLWGYSNIRTISRWETGDASIPPVAIYCMKMMMGQA